jgi:DUF2971 family protein
MGGPQRLYKYCSHGKHFIHALESARDRNEVWYSALDKVNDPFEGNPSIKRKNIREIREWNKRFYSYPEYKAKTITGVSVAEFAIQNNIDRKLARKLTSNTVENANFQKNFFATQITNYRKQQSVACFTSDPASILMWTHYANSHQGICMVWSLDGEFPSGEEEAFFPVSYLEERTEISEIDILNLICWARFKDSRVADEESARKTVKTLAFEKALPWSYEEEYRFSDFIENGGGYRKIPQYKLDSILLGVDCREATKEAVSQILGDAFPIKRVKLSETKYELILDEA